MATSFGSLGGLGGHAAVQRMATPTSRQVASPFTAFGGSGAEWESDWQRRYDEEAAKARPAMGSRTELVPDAPGFNAEAALPYHVEQRNTLGNIFDKQFGEYMGLYTPSEFDNLRGQWVNAKSTAYMHGGGGSHIVETPDYDAGYTPDFSSLNAEKSRLAPLAEQQMRQQQAFDWMQGGNQQNAVMSPDYANAGFNTITGMSNPNAGPGQIDGVGMDWAQGVYDPATQQGTGTYQPGWQRNAGFGW